MSTFNQKVSEMLNSIGQSDDELAAELEKMRNREDKKTEAAELTESLPRSESLLESASDSTAFALETIVLRVGRPVLAIKENDTILEFNDAESEIWRTRLQSVKNMLLKRIPSVGRVELQNHAFYEWVGTGWIIDKNLLITNRHVAEIFGRQNGTGFVFRDGINGESIRTSVDFLEEIGGKKERVFKITEVIHIEPESGPDMAFLRVELVSGAEFPPAIPLSASLAPAKLDVAVIGYPARDSRIPDQELMDRIFGDVYNKKRLAPGKITGNAGDRIFHDCSTLGGNSGSVVLDLNTGEAVGLHFAGRYLENNFAVASPAIAKRLKTLGNGAMSTGTSPSPNETKPSSANTGAAIPVTPMPTSTPATIKLDYSIPLQLTISVGPIESAGNNNNASVVVKPNTVDEADDQFDTEAKPEDYADRKGYNAEFLGNKFKVPPPQVRNTKLKKDVLQFTWKGKQETVLAYEHFSVVMSRSRRQCFFSAVNIDGKTSVGMKRGPWMLDPRIPVNAQIMKECYGPAPKYSRGHMTRREDPIWGQADEAARGNRDSMHVTNTVPQMQTMNGGVWLGLENYALQNARKDDVKICVFTGPVFRSNDPVQHGVKIPMSFWKVIAFIHDETKKLCATGYEISQRSFVPDTEFIFGAYETAQIPIKEIERKTGISFGNLSGLDPLSSSDNESLDVPQGPMGPLGDFGDIEFFK